MTNHLTTPVPASFWTPVAFFNDDPEKNVPTPSSLAQLSTLQVGGPIGQYCPVFSQSQLVATVKSADQAGTAVLMIGGGSNILPSEAGFSGVVIQDLRHQITVDTSAMCGGAIVSATAGTPWDALVCFTIDHDLMGLESLSGIPGTVGAAPVQNIGAYGAEVAQTLYTVTVYDRLTQKIQKLPAGDLRLRYRDSIIKESLRNPAPEVGGGRTWGPTGRWIVLEVEFQLRYASLSAPIRYQQLADFLAVDLESRVDLRQLRQAVLTLRANKGMVLDHKDPNSYSAGSFFTNPILSAAQAAALPEDAPRFPVLNTALTNPVTGVAPVVPEVLKTSAAWLIQNAGFERGFSLSNETSPTAGARISQKHVLALTNPGQARAEELITLAKEIQLRVQECYGVWLEPEPVWVGEANVSSPLGQNQTSC